MERIATWGRHWATFAHIGRVNSQVWLDTAL